MFITIHFLIGLWSVPVGRAASAPDVEGRRAEQPHADAGRPHVAHRYVKSRKTDVRKTDESSRESPDAPSGAVARE
jgi:hypothetical protein